MRLFTGKSVTNLMQFFENSVCSDNLYMTKSVVLLNLRNLTLSKSSPSSSRIDVRFA